jgi:hypothetical protein
MNKAITAVAVLYWFVSGCCNNRYPDDVVEHYKKSCVEFGLTHNECDCQITTIEGMVPYSEYKRRKAGGYPIPIEAEVEAAKCRRDQHRYPKGIVDAYITGCIGSGKTHDQCECEIQRRQQIQTYVDFIEGALEKSPVPKEIVEDSMVCLTK